MTALDRLFRPSSIAVIGGGGWCENVVRRCHDMGFEGAIWPVHPDKAEIAGLPAFRSVSDLPAAPDASFVGVNRNATIGIVKQLAARGAGGAVCFASGFSEATAELSDGSRLQDELLAAAGQMPFLGPNCYGFINYLDGALLWPDQHGGKRCESGVAILTQSSNIALNLTMQRRGLPIAYIVTAGNQAQTGLAAIGRALLADPRVTALGLHIEGMGDIRAFETLAESARNLGKRIVALKAGKSEQARAATVSHTASLAGSDAGSKALLKRLGVGQVHSLTGLLESLMLLHVAGSLPSNRIASMSCSGGEASLMADSGHGRNIVFPPLSKAQETDLRLALGPKVALANPLDYHTYIWGNEQSLAQAFSAMMDPSLALGCIILDFPRGDRCSASDWEPVISAALSAQRARGVRMALVSSLPDNMPEDVAERLVALGIVPLHGLDDALTAIEIASQPMPDKCEPVLLPRTPSDPVVLSEEQAKTALSKYGLRIPRFIGASSPEEAARVAEQIGFPVVLKAVGLAHKTEAGGVAVGLRDKEEVRFAAMRMPTERLLVEEMVSGAVAELLVGIVVDPAHGYVLTLAAGGSLTELLDDNETLLLPASDDDIRAALSRLKLSPMLSGYRGAASADMPAIVGAVQAVSSYATSLQGKVAEVEVNPLICTAQDAVAADALIRTEE